MQQLAGQLEKVGPERVPINFFVPESAGAIKAWRAAVKRQREVEEGMEEVSFWSELETSLLNMNAGMPFLVSLVQLLWMATSQRENSNSFGSRPEGLFFYVSLALFALALIMAGVQLSRVLWLIEDSDRHALSSGKRVSASISSFFASYEWRNATDTALGSLLHLAAARGLKEVASCLIARGAKTCLLDSAGRTSFEVATDGGFPELAAYLREGGLSNTDTSSGTATPSDGTTTHRKTSVALLAATAVMNLQSNIQKRARNAGVGDGDIEAAQAQPVTRGAWPFGGKNSGNASPTHMTRSNTNRARQQARRGSVIGGSSGSSMRQDGVVAQLNLMWGLGHMGRRSSPAERRMQYGQLRLTSPFPVPMMHVISFADLLSMQRIPRRAGKHYLGESVCKPRPVTSLPKDSAVVFVSHRWLEPEFNHPDNSVKMRWSQVCALVYRLSAELEADPMSLYLWIDYSCCNFQQPGPDLQAVPYFLLCCECLCYIEHEDYWERAWPKAEHSLYQSLHKATDRKAHVYCLSADGSSLQRKLSPELRRLSEQPLGGKLSFESDRTALWMMLLAADFYVSCGVVPKMVEEEEDEAAVLMQSIFGKKAVPAIKATDLPGKAAKRLTAGSEHGNHTSSNGTLASDASVRSASPPMEEVVADGGVESPGKEVMPGAVTEAEVPSKISCEGEEVAAVAAAPKEVAEGIGGAEGPPQDAADVQAAAVAGALRGDGSATATATDTACRAGEGTGSAAIEDSSGVTKASEIGTTSEGGAADHESEDVDMLDQVASTATPGRTAAADAEVVEAQPLVQPEEISSAGGGGTDTSEAREGITQQQQGGETGVGQAEGSKPSSVEGKAPCENEVPATIASGQGNTGDASDVAVSGTDLPAEHRTEVAATASAPAAGSGSPKAKASAGARATTGVRGGASREDGRGAGRGRGGRAAAGRGGRGGRAVAGRGGKKNGKAGQKKAAQGRR
ncbi:unnamed protein product [Chrysoparadoxa australica]